MAHFKKNFQFNIVNLTSTSNGSQMYWKLLNEVLEEIRPLVFEFKTILDSKNTRSLSFGALGHQKTEWNSVEDNLFPTQQVKIQLLLTHTLEWCDANCKLLNFLLQRCNSDQNLKLTIMIWFFSWCDFWAPILIFDAPKWSWRLEDWARWNAQTPFLQNLPLII